MNVTAMIRRLRGQKYKVTRANSDGSYSATDGSFVAGVTITFDLMGSVQPLNGEDLISIPEGDRTTERFRFYSFAPLQTNDTARLRKGDVVDVNGVNYQVEGGLDHWPTHTKAIIARVNTNAN